LKRRQFGASSEKSDVDLRQMTLFTAGEVAPPPEAEEISYSRKKRKGKREEDLSGLPVERIDYELSEKERTCPACGDTMRDIGTQTRRELKLIPAKLLFWSMSPIPMLAETANKPAQRFLSSKPKPLNR